MSDTVSRVANALRRADSSGRSDYEIIGRAPKLGSGHLAVSRKGHRSFVVPLENVTTDVTRLTQGLALRAAKVVDFERAGKRWQKSAAVFECRDASLLQTFAGMVVAIAARLGTEEPTWKEVTALFAEWEHLLARRRVLETEGEIGLWGELWWLSRSRHADQLLAGWRGPEAEKVDFLIAGRGFEMKTGRRPGVHVVSQKQIEDGVGDAHVLLVSMYALPDPVNGSSLPELVDEVAGRISDAAAFEQTLASVGYARADASAYTKKWVLMEAPLFYERSSVPRVRVADRGVFDLRYRVELDRREAVAGAILSEATKTLGFDPSRCNFPCG